MAKKSDYRIYLEELSDKIKEFLNNEYTEQKSENLEWEKAWTFVNPINGINNFEYKGTNKMMLSLSAPLQGFSDPRWVTFNQANTLSFGNEIEKEFKEQYEEKLKEYENKLIEKEKTGSKQKIWKPKEMGAYHVKKGEKATKIVYNLVHIETYSGKDYKKGIVTWLEWNKLKKELNEKGKDIPNIKPFNKVYYVFNFQQLENYDLIPAFENEFTNENIDVADTLKTIAKNIGVEVNYDGGNRAFYNTIDDAVHIPKPEFFKSQEGFNSTLLHELSHSTGHKKRLNRDLNNSFGSTAYAREELVAEISAVFLNGLMPNVMTEEHYKNHLAYLQSWNKILSGNPYEIKNIIDDANKVSDYITDAINKDLTLEFENENSIEIEKNLLTEQDFILDKAVKKWCSINYMKDYEVTGKTLPSEIIKKSIVLNNETIAKTFIENNKEEIPNINEIIKTEYSLNLNHENNPIEYANIMAEKILYDKLLKSEFISNNFKKKIKIDDLKNEIIKVMDIDIENKEIEYNRNDYWKVEYNEFAITDNIRDYTNELVTENLITEVIKSDNEHKNIDYGYNKIYFDHYKNGECINHLRLDIGDGYEANKDLYENLETSVKEGFASINNNLNKEQSIENIKIVDKSFELE